MVTTKIIKNSDGTRYVAVFQNGKELPKQSPKEIDIHNVSI